MYTVFVPYVLHLMKVYCRNERLLRFELLHRRKREGQSEQRCAMGSERQSEFWRRQGYSGGTRRSELDWVRLHRFLSTSAVEPMRRLTICFPTVRSGSSWLFFTPELMRAVLVWIKDEYNNPPVYVTENGFSDKTGQLNDDGRVNYYKFYINNVLQGWWTEL